MRKRRRAAFGVPSGASISASSRPAGLSDQENCCRRRIHPQFGANRSGRVTSPMCPVRSIIAYSAPRTRPDELAGRAHRAHAIELRVAGDDERRVRARCAQSAAASAGVQPHARGHLPPARSAGAAIRARCSAREPQPRRPAVDRRRRSPAPHPARRASRETPASSARDLPDTAPASATASTPATASRRRSARTVRSGFAAACLAATIPPNDMPQIAALSTPLSIEHPHRPGPPESSSNVFADPERVADDAAPRRQRASARGTHPLPASLDAGNHHDRRSGSLVEHHSAGALRARVIRRDRSELSSLLWIVNSSAASRSSTCVRCVRASSARRTGSGTPRARGPAAAVPSACPDA